MHQRHGDRDPEDLRTFDEERTELRIEQREALIDLDLGFVGLDL
jgi:hypothetical protein